MTTASRTPTQYHAWVIVLAIAAATVVLVLLASVAATAGESKDWVFDQGNYTDSPKTGQRVEQYQKIAPPQRDPDALFDSPIGPFPFEPGVEGYYGGYFPEEFGPDPFYGPYAYPHGVYPCTYGPHPYGMLYPTY